MVAVALRAGKPTGGEEQSIVTAWEALLRYARRSGHWASFAGHAR